MKSMTIGTSFAGKDRFLKCVPYILCELRYHNSHVALCTVVKFNPCSVECTTLYSTFLIGLTHYPALL